MNRGQGTGDRGQASGVRGQASEGIARVLRPGGRAVFLEPLIHNPILEGYRRLTPHLRSPTERALSMRDVATIGSHFCSCQHQEFILLAILPAAGGGRAGANAAHWTAGGGACKRSTASCWPSGPAWAATTGRRSSHSSDNLRPSSYAEVRTFRRLLAELAGTWAVSAYQRLNASLCDM